jgi:hypothetical protein
MRQGNIAIVEFLEMAHEALAMRPTRPESTMAEPALWKARNGRYMSIFPPRSMKFSGAPTIVPRVRFAEPASGASLHGGFCMLRGEIVNRHLHLDGQKSTLLIMRYVGWVLCTQLGRFGDDARQ